SFIVEGLVAILKKRYRTLAVYGGQQCLDMLSKEKPSIIILDIMMEPMDGWETLSRIKENPGTRHIPVLMFSAKKISAEEADEHRISIDDFISKPVTPKKLIEAIEKVLDRQKANILSIESWRSAGIGEDRIEDYTSLMTNLEVDLSLLQNMKVQLSLVRDDDEKIRTDLEAVIAAIEARIQEERLHEVKLSHAMQESIARDAEERERTGPVPLTRENEPENPLYGGEYPAAAQPELPYSSNVDESEKTPSLTEVPGPEAGVVHEPPLPEITPQMEVQPTHSSEPGATVIPESAGPGSLPEYRVLPESLSEEPGMKAPASSRADEPPVLSAPLPPAEIPDINSGTAPFFRETAPENSGSEVNVSSEVNVPSVMEQKYPAARIPRPLSARTLDNKPVLPDAPIPKAVGSGTDTSMRRTPYSVGRSYGKTGTDGKDKNDPDNEKTPLSEGFFSRIISTILGLFKRQGK
ncbi:MAG: response regulator, partial [Methanoregula sp.]|nr:response regulator [Methanoregula sp.]